MADSSDGGGGLGGFLLLGVLGLMGLAAASSEAQYRSLPALPPPRPKLPPTFVPTGGPHRIRESRCVVYDGGREYSAQEYEPPMNPAPWKVRAWYEPHRGAHVIDVVAHEALREPGAMAVKVFVGDKHQADREAFKYYKKPLWPDDKYLNRVVHRAPTTVEGVCFLIDITAGGFHLDFFHEPVGNGGLSLVDDTPNVVKRFDELEKFAEVEKQYADARDRLEQRTDLSPEIKRQLEARLMLFYEQCLREIGGTP